MPAESNALAVTKAAEGQFQRGFKTWCENMAVNIRKREGLEPTSPLRARELAKSMGVSILELESVPGLEDGTIKYLSSVQGDEWSAVTVHCDDRQFIVVNPRHSEARQSSNIMHELAHLIRKHKPTQVHVYDAFALRDFDPLQENEANWLAGCLLLPREALLHTGKQNIDADQIIEIYNVSRSLYNYRLNVSGVRRQLLASSRNYYR